jgi:hypothetical protein
MRTYVLVSGVVFGVVTAVQVIRLFGAWPVTIAGVAVPLWASAVAALIAAALAIWAARLLARSGTTTQVVT